MVWLARAAAVTSTLQAPAAERVRISVSLAAGRPKLWPAITTVLAPEALLVMASVPAPLNAPA